MDFGDILIEWEKNERNSKKQTKKQKGSKKHKTPTTDEQVKDVQKRVNPMDEWLRRYGIVDKDALAEKQNEAQKRHSKKGAKSFPIDARIDLHNLRQEEAWIDLDRFVFTCARQGLKKILIVHGKGNNSQDNPVLGNMVRSFIEHDKRLGASGHPPSSDGGSGATWVMIKY